MRTIDNSAIQMVYSVSLCAVKAPNVDMYSIILSYTFENEDRTEINDSNFKDAPKLAMLTDFIGKDPKSLLLDASELASMLFLRVHEQVFITDNEFNVVEEYTLSELYAEELTKVPGRVLN